MRIAVLGCSYSNWWDGNIFNESVPALIAKDNANITMYDASVGGSGNNSLYLRVKHIEKEFGPLDKVIVQLTTPQRTSIILSKNAIKQLGIWKKTCNYYYIDGNSSDWIMLTKGKMKSKEFMQKFGLLFPLESSLDYMNYYNKTFDPYFQTQQQIDLLNYKYGKENVLFYSWFNENKKLIELPTNYIGSVQQHFGIKMNKFKIDNEYHFNNHGHSAVYKWLKPSIGKLLANGDKYVYNET